MSRYIAGMNRRDFLGAIGVAVFATPLAAEAQPQRKVYRIGYLAPHLAHIPLDNAFDAGMIELGYREGQNLVVERRYRLGQYDAANEAVQDVLRLNVDVIVAWA